MSTDTDGVSPSVAPGSDDPGAAETAESGMTWLQAEMKRRMAAAQHSPGGRHARHGGPDPAPVRDDYRARHASERSRPAHAAGAPVDAGSSPAVSRPDVVDPAAAGDWVAGAASDLSAAANWAATAGSATDPASAAWSTDASMWTLPPPTEPQPGSAAGSASADVVPLPARPAPAPEQPAAPADHPPDDAARATLGTVIPLRPPTPGLRDEGDPHPTSEGSPEPTDQRDPAGPHPPPSPPDAAGQDAVEIAEATEGGTSAVTATEGDTAPPSGAVASLAASESTAALPALGDPTDQQNGPSFTAGGSAVEQANPNSVPTTWSGFVGSSRPGAADIAGFGGPSLPDNHPVRRPRRATPPAPPGSVGGDSADGPSAPAAGAEPISPSAPSAGDGPPADTGPTTEQMSWPAVQTDGSPDSNAEPWRPPRPGDPQPAFGPPRPVPPSGGAAVRLLADPPALPPTVAIPTVPGMPARTPSAVPPSDDHDYDDDDRDVDDGYRRRSGYGGYAYGRDGGYRRGDEDNSRSPAGGYGYADYSDDEDDDFDDGYDDDHPGTEPGDGGVIWRAAPPALVTTAPGGAESTAPGGADSAASGGPAAGGLTCTSPVPAASGPASAASAPGDAASAPGRAASAANGGPAAVVTTSGSAPASSDPSAGPPLPPGKRVRVVLAERKAAARPVRTVVDLQGDNPVGEALRSGLIADQLRVALRFALLGGLTLGVLPLLFDVVPEIGTIAILGLRLPWLVLGILVYPFLFGLGWWFTRTTERVEKDFADHIQDN